MSGDIAFDYAPAQVDEAEQTVIGSLLYSPELVVQVAPVLTAADFYRPAHQTIYQAILDQYGESKPYNLNGVTVALRRNGTLERVGGAAYLDTLVDRWDPAHATYFATVVSEEAARRRLQMFHARGLHQVTDGTYPDLQGLLDATQSGLDDVVDNRVSNAVVRADDALTRTLQHMETLAENHGEITGVPTGFAELDRMTGGLHPGQMITVAARPAVGKSTLGLDVARSAAIHNGIPTLFFSLEMSVEEITMRLMSAEARVQLQKVRSGRLEQEDWARWSRKAEPVASAPLFIDDTATVTMTEIKSKARQVKERHGLGLIIIDYLQLMNADRRSDSRQQEVSDMSRAVKLLAKDLQVPVIVMSQLNRGPESRADKKPAVSDLRESGAIEQDSDIILLLFREDVNEPEHPRAGEADIIVGKHRNGPTGVVTVAFQGHLSRFVDMAQDPV